MFISPNIWNYNHNCFYYLTLNSRYCCLLQHHCFPLLMKLNFFCNKKNIVKFIITIIFNKQNLKFSYLSKHFCLEFDMYSNINRIQALNSRHYCLLQHHCFSLLMKLNFCVKKRRLYIYNYNYFQQIKSYIFIPFKTLFVLNLICIRITIEFKH